MSELEDFAPDTLPPPRIPDGEYVVEFIGHFTAKMFREQTPKVGMRFTIVEGDFEGFEILRFYSVRRLIGKAGPDGKFVAKSWTCRQMMEFCLCFPDQELTRLDRLPMSRWHQGRFRVTTRKATNNHEGEIKPDQIRFSVISRILGGVE